MSHEKSYSKMTWAVTKLAKNKILVKRTVINSVSILSPSLIIKVREWYFVTKIVLTYCEKKLF